MKAKLIFNLIGLAFQLPDFYGQGVNLLAVFYYDCIKQGFHFCHTARYDPHVRLDRFERGVPHQTGKWTGGFHGTLTSL
jgi:hypothetical protein